jgi:glyoxalase family protein
MADEKAEPALTTVGGIHHITSIATDPKRTQEFYVGTLGLHHVRKMVTFDEPSVLHFYFGDRRSSPGSMITFFVHGAEPPSLCGLGHVSSIVFTVPPGTLQSWHHCLVERGADVTGNAWSFGEECLCFRDPDGLELALIEEATETSSNDQDREGPTDRAIRRIRSVEIQIDGFQHASQFLTERLGFEEFGQESAVFRFLDGPPDRSIAVDLLCIPTHRPGHTGPGVAHHIALRVADSEALGRIATMLANCGFDVTPPLYRQYFQSACANPGDASMHIRRSPALALATGAPRDRRSLIFASTRSQRRRSWCHFSPKLSQFTRQLGHGVQWVSLARGSARSFQAFVKHGGLTISSEFISKTCNTRRTAGRCSVSFEPYGTI